MANDLVSELQKLKDKIDAEVHSNKDYSVIGIQKLAYPKAVSTAIRSVIEYIKNDQDDPISQARRDLPA